MTNGPTNPATEQLIAGKDAVIRQLREELRAFKPQPMSQQCRAGRHKGPSGTPCTRCRCLCHTAEAEVLELRQELGQLRGRLSRQQRAVEAIRAISGGGEVPPEWGRTYRDRAEQAEKDLAGARVAVRSALRLLDNGEGAAARDLLRNTVEPPRREPTPRAQRTRPEW